MNKRKIDWLAVALVTWCAVTVAYMIGVNLL